MNKIIVKSWGRISLVTILLYLFFGCVLYSLFYDVAAVLVPIIVAPLPTLLSYLYVKNKGNYLNWMLVCVLIALLIIIFDLLTYLLYYISMYGKSTTHLILWKDYICFICSLTMLHLSALFPTLLHKRKTTVTTIWKYICITAVILVLATIAWVLNEFVALLFPMVLISLVALLVSMITIYTMQTLILLKVANKAVSAPFSFCKTKWATNTAPQPS